VLSADMNIVEEIVSQLQRMYEKLANLERKRRLRNLLKIVGIGFLLYRNVDQDISDIQNRIASLIARATSRLKNELFFFD
jgi:hypothetical protein